jgi:putative ABC transport system permease protein
MSLLRLAFLSLVNRRGTALLAVFSIALSVALLLGVEKVRNGARASFAGTISGTDLIVGARAGDVQLLLYSVFRIGDATNNITWESYREIAARPEVAWIVPLSLGDSHRGYRVVGTTTDFFAQYRYRRDTNLRFAAGEAFDDLFDAVIGADVAEALGYGIGAPIVVAHGTASAGQDHDNRPFRVSGILERTGTPVDTAVHVSLEAIEAIHVDWRSGARVEALDIPEERIRAMDLTPKTVTAALVGLKSRLQAFRFRRFVNEYEAEPLTAVLPGVALTRLWSLVGVAERALSAVSLMVVLTALIGLVSTLLASLQERRREMAILRANGARPLHIAGLLITESGLLTLAGAVVGVGIVYLGLLGLTPWINDRFGLSLEIGLPASREWLMLAGIVGAGFLAGCIPAWKAYRTSLADGMTIRS